MTAAKRTHASTCWYCLVRSKIANMNIFEENSSSDEDDSVTDEDSCNYDELNNLFTNQYQLESEQCVSLKRSYILHMASPKTFDRIAAGTSSQKIHLFDITRGLSRLQTPKCLDNLNSPIKGLKYTNLSPESILVSTNKSIILTDLRSEEIVHTFVDDSDDLRKKSINCFDINSNDRILCAGTEQVNQESFLLYFDIRERRLLGAYWDSHQDDITDIKFNSKNPDLFVSGSTDGLICVFDISQTGEDDALLCTLNTDSSVGNINWHQDVFGKQIVSCITHTNDLQLYNVADFDDAEMLIQFDRETVTKEMKRKSVMHCSLINCHSTIDNDILLIAGSNYDKGKCLRSLVYRNRRLVPSTDFVGNKQIVRTSIFYENTNTLISAGENGFITVWHPESNINIQMDTLKSSNLKEKSYKKRKHTSPY